MCSTNLYCANNFNCIYILLKDKWKVVEIEMGCSTSGPVEDRSANDVTGMQVCS
jgi:hypothetical protein